jgi:SAM-dependent methyltransferase
MQLKKYIPLTVKQRAHALLYRVQLVNAKYYCPVCESRVAYFLPLPDFYRENLEKYGFPYPDHDAETCNQNAYLCPACKGSDRDRLIALYLKDYLPRLKDASPLKIVEFGPSAPLSAFVCRQIKSLRREVLYRTADLLAEGADDKVDITDLRLYKDNEFDFFICSHVLEHVADDKKALLELRRILKPGGQGILLVPIILSIDQIEEDNGVMDEGERWRRFGQYDHVRLYSKSGFLERVRQTGFKVNEYNEDSFGADVFRRTGISTQSVLYVVEK